MPYLAVLYWNTDDSHAVVGASRSSSSSGGETGHLSVAILKRNPNPGSEEKDGAEEIKREGESVKVIEGMSQITIVEDDDSCAIDNNCKYLSFWGHVGNCFGQKGVVHNNLQVDIQQLRRLPTGVKVIHINQDTYNAISQSMDADFRDPGCWHPFRNCATLVKDKLLRAVRSQPEINMRSSPCERASGLIDTPESVYSRFQAEEAGVVRVEEAKVAGGEEPATRREIFRQGGGRIYLRLSLM